MIAKRTSASIIIVFLFLLAQTACGTQVATEPIPMATLTKIPSPMTTLTPTLTPTLKAGLTLYPTVDTTQQTWRSTAEAVQTIERATSVQSWDAQKTQIAEFSIDCDFVNSYTSEISPDGKWFAASCDDKENSTLVVRNKSGAKWVLKFKDFLSKASPEGMWGSIFPKFWSPDGNYLYFTIGLGYSGGGNYCFPAPGDYGEYGLFRLNLESGLWATVIPPTDSFPGYEIQFSPTGRRFAITIDGVMITDLRTGEITKIDTNQTVERLSWSPDGRYLAYSLASCDDQSILSSSVNIWDVQTKQTKPLLKMDGIILRPESWTDNATLRIIGQEISGLNYVYILYEYGVEQEKLLFTATATPYP